MGRLDEADQRMDTLHENGMQKQSNVSSAADLSRESFSAEFELVLASTEMPS